MKNFSVLLVVVLLAAAGQRAAAQESMWGRGPDEPLPPNRYGDGLDLLHSREAFDAIGPTADAALEPTPEELPPGDAGEAATGEVMGEEFGGSILGEPMKMLEACNPLYFESTGTWLRRGFWYAEGDFLFLGRSWDRKGLSLASETALSSLIPGNQNVGPFLISNELRIRGERPGGEGVGRVKLGRFLFRDAYNRDHLAEVGWYGGGEWLQEASLNAATAAGLEVTDFIDRVNPSFDGARSLSFRHESELNSAEANYVVKQRMHRDQMVMQPSGEWIRKATPSRTVTFLVGARYLNLRELLDFNATDVDVQAGAGELREDGFYSIQTDNDMFGGQFGVGLAHETARWSIGALAKAGAYINRVDLNSRFQVGETMITNSGATNAEEDDLSFVSEAQLMAKWHLRPNVSLRAGLEMLFIDSIALAPYQLNFIPGGYDQIANSGDSVFLGTSFGVESHW